MSRNIKALQWALLATALFAVVAAIAKVAVSEFHVLQILFFRQIFVFLSAIPTILSNFKSTMKTQHPWLHLLRLTGAFIALSGGILAISGLPLATATTLGFAKVMFVAILAHIFLNETLGAHRTGAILVGFVGVMVVIRPDIAGFGNFFSLIALASALSAAVAAVCVRKLSQSESTATLLAYQALFVGILAAVPLVWLWRQPDLTELLFLCVMGIFATVGQWVAVKALRMGEAGLVGNMQYSSLVFASLLGYVLFGETPDRYTLLGAVIIILASLYIMRREALRSKESNLADEPRSKSTPWKPRLKA